MKPFNLMRVLFLGSIFLTNVVFGQNNFHFIELSSSSDSLFRFKYPAGVYYFQENAGWLFKITNQGNENLEVYYLGQAPTGTIFTPNEVKILSMGGMVSDTLILSKNDQNSLQVRIANYMLYQNNQKVQLVDSRVISIKDPGVDVGLY
jgi:hypothetical protein